MNNIFSINRTLKLIRKDLLSEYKNLIIWLCTAAGVMIVVSALSILLGKLQGGSVDTGGGFHRGIYTILLFPGGYVLTSSMFKDVHDKSRSIYWLTLPGSTFEKSLSRLLISSVFFVVLLTLIYPILSSISELFNLAVFGIKHEVFNPFSIDVLKMIPYYLVTQSIFFAGAAAFRKHPLPKTLLSLALFQIVFSIIALIFTRIIFGSYFNSLQNLSFTGTDFFNISSSSLDSLTNFGKFATMTGKVLFWYIMAPFFYILSYFKLSEKEVLDGI